MIKSIVLGRNRIIKRNCRPNTKRPRTRIFTLQRTKRGTRKTALCIGLRPYGRANHAPPYARTVVRTKITGIITKVISPSPEITNDNVTQLQRTKVRIIINIRRTTYRQLGRKFVYQILGRHPFKLFGCTVALSNGVTATANRDR